MQLQKNSTKITDRQHLVLTEAYAVVSHPPMASSATCGSSRGERYDNMFFTKFFLAWTWLLKIISPRQNRNVSRISCPESHGLRDFRTFWSTGWLVYPCDTLFVTIPRSCSRMTATELLVPAQKQSTSAVLNSLKLAAMSSTSFIFLLPFKFIYVRVVPCSRWSEMTESLRFHVELAHTAQSPTEFRMLNGAKIILEATIILTMIIVGLMHQIIFAYHTFIANSTKTKFTSYDSRDVGASPIHVGQSLQEDETNVPKLMALFGINLIMSRDVRRSSCS